MSIQTNAYADCLSLATRMYGDKHPQFLATLRNIEHNPPEKEDLQKIHFIFLQLNPILRFTHSPIARPLISRVAKVVTSPQLLEHLSTLSLLIRNVDHPGAELTSDEIKALFSFLKSPTILKENKEVQTALLDIFYAIATDRGSLKHHDQLIKLGIFQALASIMPDIIRGNTLTAGRIFLCLIRWTNEKEGIGFNPSNFILTLLSRSDSGGGSYMEMCFTIIALLSEEVYNAFKDIEQPFENFQLCLHAQREQPQGIALPKPLVHLIGRYCAAGKIADAVHTYFEGAS